MYTTYTFARNLFDEIADSAFGNHNTTGLMNTDIRETEKGFEMAIDLPGVEKENVNAELKDGYLYISAAISRGPECRESRPTAMVRWSDVVDSRSASHCANTKPIRAAKVSVRSAASPRISEPLCSFSQLWVLLLSELI